MLTGAGIRAAIDRGEIEIDPFDRLAVGPNSVDLRLSPIMYAYGPGTVFDTRAIPSDGAEIRIPLDGYVLLPGHLYLGSTIERTRSGSPWIPGIEGRSSLGRLGLKIHSTAGFGDVGFNGNWTLEIEVAFPTRVYAGERIAQLYFYRADGPVESMYKGKYQGQCGPTRSKKFLDWD